jgi:hypothetical protein
MVDCTKHMIEFLILGLDGQFVRFYATQKKPLNLDFAGNGY